MSTPLKIQIIVDDKGSVKIRQVGTEAEKAGRKGETAFRRTGKSLDEMNRKAAKATSHVLKLAAAAVSIGALYLAFRKITREVSEFIDLAGKQEAVEKRVEAVLKATGQAAGYNLSQLTAMASGMQKLTTVGDEVILSGQAILLTFKKIRGEGFERATMAALDMAEVMEGDLKGSIVMIGKALNDPIANLSAMTRAGVQFTAGQKDMIKQLWLSGKTMEAQNIILTELESQFGGAAAAARETYSGALKAAKNATGDLKEEVGFLIIKNEASIVLIKEVETWSIKMTTAIRDNKQAALEFVQDGLVALVAGAESAVKAIAYLIESIQNVSRVWLMTKSAFLSMEIQATKFKLWANEGEVSEKKIRMELLALEQAYADVALAIAATDKAHADMVDIVERATGGLSRLQEKLAELEVGLGSIDIPIDDFHGGMKKVNDTLDDTAKTLKELEKYLEGVESALNNVTTESTGAWFAYKQFHEGLGSSSGDLETVRLRLTGIYGEMAAIAQLEGEIDVTVNGIEDIKKLMGALDELESRASSSFKGESFGDGISQGINNAMRSFEELSDMYKEQAKIEKELIEKRKEANNIEDIEKRIKALEKIGDTEMELIDKQLAGYRQLFGTLKDLFDENSKEREAMHKAEQAFAILEIALEMRKSLAIITGYFAQSAAATVAATTQNAANTSTALTGAAASVAAQGTVPVAGFAMVGAMLALMAGVLAMGGIAFGGGASVSIPEVPNYGPSTVLGAEPGTPSESIQNTYEMLEDAHADEYAALMDIYREVQDLNQNITGLVTGLIKGVGGDFGAIDTQMGDWIGGAENFWNKFTEGFAKFLSLDPIISIITKYVGGWISKLLGNIFGGGGYTDLAYAGIEFGEQALGDILRGADVLAKVFATIHKHTEGGWFGSDKDEWYTEYETLDQDAIDLLTKVFKSIGDSFVYLAEGLGVDVQKVYDYIIPLTKLDLKGMNADQISEAVSNFFSNMTDQMAEDLFGPIIKKYQQVGEGLYETAVRLVMEKEIFLSVLTMTGMAFEGTAEQAIALSQAVIDAAGGLEKLTEAAEAYFDGFLTDAEKFAFMGDSLAQAFDNLDVAFPTTRQGFKDLLNSIDLTTESGQDLYAALLNLAAASDEYYDTVEAGTQSIIDAQRELSGTQELGLSEDIAEKYGISLGTITKDWFRGMREMFLALSPEELAAWAATLGVSAEELAEDFLDLADAFGFVGMTIADAAEEIAKLFQGVNDFLSGTGLADKATRLWTQLFKTSTPFMTVAEGGGGKVPTPAELANMSERLSEWFYAAEAAARELGQAELEAIKLEEQVITSISNLIDQIDATIMSIKTSGLNVSLPTQIAEEIAVDYEAAYAAAHAGGTAEIQKYLSIAQTHLGTYQAAHKSSEKYQDEYARVMGHMEAMKADLEAGGYDAKILAELEKGNELTIEQTAAYIAAMEDVNANWTLGTDWINAWVGKLEEAHLAIDIDWGNYDGSIADALEMLMYIVDIYGWDNQFTINFISDMAKWAAEDVKRAIDIIKAIPDDMWETEAVLTFTAVLAENMKNLTDAKTVLDLLVAESPGGWNSKAVITFLDHVDMDIFTTVGQKMEAIGYIANATGIKDGYVSEALMTMLAKFSDNEMPWGEIKQALVNAGATDQTVTKTLQALWINSTKENWTWDEFVTNWGLAGMTGSWAEKNLKAIYEVEGAGALAYWSDFVVAFKMMGVSDQNAQKILTSVYNAVGGQPDIATWADFKTAMTDTGIGKDSTAWKTIAAAYNKDTGAFFSTWYQLAAALGRNGISPTVTKTVKAAYESGTMTWTELEDMLDETGTPASVIRDIKATVTTVATIELGEQDVWLAQLELLAGILQNTASTAYQLGGWYTRFDTLANMFPEDLLYPGQMDGYSTPGSNTAGFKFDSNGYLKVVEQDRMNLYYGGTDSTFRIMAINLQRIANAYATVTPYADGGIASGPESGYAATLHGTELIVSPRSNYPATLVNDGRTQQDSPIELNLTIELDGEILDTKIVRISRREADDIRIQAARRPGIGTGRIV